jgi:small subunit ribosomal protein S15
MSIKTKTDWVKAKPDEVKKLIVELAKQNNPPEKIGLILRDQHGIPKAKIFGKKISQILKENDIHMNSEYENLSKKIEMLKKHTAKHKHDYTAKRIIVKHVGRINKLKKLQ